jgi:hypothetical protein
MLIKKCHHMQVLSIVGMYGTPSDGVLLKGRVVFFPGKKTFGFIVNGTDESEMKMLCRNEWHVTMCEHMYEHLACNQK